MISYFHLSILVIEISPDNIRRNTSSFAEILFARLISLGCKTNTQSGISNEIIKII